MDGIVIPDDPIILDMLPDFVESWRRDISSRYNSAVERQDAEELFRFGHTLRGSGRQFGLLSMSEMGMQLQEFARANDFASMQALGTAMSTELDRIQSYLIEKGFAPADRFSTLPSNL